MAFWKLTRPAWIHGNYYAATPQQPLVIELPASVKPSIHWEAVAGPATTTPPVNLPGDAKSFNEMNADKLKAKEVLGKSGMGAPLNK